MDAKDRRIAELETEVKALRAQVATLTDQVSKLAAALDEARRGGKRQAAPFRKQDQPAGQPKKPGRKKGRRQEGKVREKGSVREK